VIRRILVALDATPNSLAALRSAAELAASLDSELVGLFVEDAEMLEAAQLTTTREVGSFSAVVRDLGCGDLRRQMLAQAEQAQRALASTAGKLGVRWTFRVARGHVPSELLAATRQADLVTVGRSATPWGSARTLGPTLCRLIEQGTGYLLILQRGHRLGAVTVVVHDGASSGDEALRLGASMAGSRRGGRLLVLLPAEAPGQLPDRIHNWLESTGLRHELRQLRSVKATRIATAVRTANGGILLLPADSGLTAPDSLAALLDQVDCPVLLVRTEPEPTPS
jgi:nucleotide-binding universal stress UspA family protein